MKDKLLLGLFKQLGLNYHKGRVTNIESTCLGLEIENGIQNQMIISANGEKYWQINLHSSITYFLEHYFDVADQHM